MRLSFVVHAACLLSSAACSCAARPSGQQPSPQGAALPAPAPLASASTAARARSVATPPDPCPALGPNEVSDDETPSIAGTSGRAKAGDWLDARGVSKAAFRAWVRAHDPQNLEDFDADTLYDAEDSCLTTTVGDKKEDALVCTLAVRTSIMRYSAVALVVRGKHIASVLDVGYSLPAMDWPDSSWLDLQVAFAAGGLEADVGDRAGPGAVLVRSPSSCRQHYAAYLACEKAHQEGTASEALCPLAMDASGKTSIGHLSPEPPESPMGGDSVALHGCAEALPKLDELIKQDGAKGPFAAEFRGDRAFAIKSCRARGHYVWKGDHFVRSLP